MSDSFFERPIINSPYEYPSRHWELDKDRQPTNTIIDARRGAGFLTPIPRPKKRRAGVKQSEIVFDKGEGLSTQKQQYEQSRIINEVRANVDAWRRLQPSQWQVTPETARSSTGAPTRSTTFGRSSARSKRRRRPSG